MLHESLSAEMPVTHAPGRAHATLAQVDCWLFDLDNTLYSPEIGLFAEVDLRMGAYIMRLLDCDAVEARRVQKLYFHDHGTTLAGLMRHHAIDPEEFLADVHAVHMDKLTPDPELRSLIERLPGDKHIFTNANRAYAEQVLDRRGLGGLFGVIVDITGCGYIPKPEPGAYATLTRMIDGFDPRRACLFDDMSRNLAPAHALGMTTVWLANGSESGERGHDPAHTDHNASDLRPWLERVVPALERNHR